MVQDYATQSVAMVPPPQQTYEEIWEKDDPWLSGRQILSPIVDQLKDKSLIVAASDTDSSVLDLTFPFPTVTVIGGGKEFRVLYQIPTPLQHIFMERLQLVIDAYTPRVREVFNRFEGQFINPQTIACINEDLRRQEHMMASERSPTLADWVADSFGLFSAVAIERARINAGLEDRPRRRR